LCVNFEWFAFPSLLRPNAQIKLVWLLWPSPCLYLHPCILHAAMRNAGTVLVRLGNSPRDTRVHMPMTSHPLILPPGGIPEIVVACPGILLAMQESRVLCMSRSPRGPRVRCMPPLFGVLSGECLAQVVAAYMRNRAVIVGLAFGV
jgi:hypothetical protein